MPKIFVSYRRIDSQERAHRIADWLVLKYGRENVFIDVDTIGASTRIMRGGGIANSDKTQYSAIRFRILPFLSLKDYGFHCMRYIDS